MYLNVVFFLLGDFPFSELYVPSAHKIQMPGNHPKERIQHSQTWQKFEIKNNSPVIWRKLQETFSYSNNSVSIKPHFSLPFLSSSTVKIMTPYLVSYSSITSSTPTPPTESINAPVMPYCGKGYIITDKNLTTYLAKC
jgi:hypothetical protein